MRRDDPPDADLSEGNNCLEYPGVPGVPGLLSGLPNPMESSMFPPLPELTVMWGGRIGLNELLDAIAKI